MMVGAVVIVRAAVIGIALLHSCTLLTISQFHNSVTFLHLHITNNVDTRDPIAYKNTLQVC